MFSKKKNCPQHENDYSKSYTERQFLISHIISVLILLKNFIFFRFQNHSHYFHVAFVLFFYVINYEHFFYYRWQIHIVRI